MGDRPVVAIASSPAIDRTVEVDRLRPGGDHRATRAETRAGGKGVNVTRALVRCGVPVRLVLAVGGPMGRALAGLLADEGLPVATVVVRAPTRSSLVMVDPETVTIVNDPGATLDPEEWARVLGVAAEALEPGGVLTCSGSLPGGLGHEAVGSLVALARERGAWSLLDSSGAGLRAALAAGADVVLPNVDEAATALGRARAEAEVGEGGTLDEAAELAAALRAEGAGAAVVSAGAAGAAVAEPGGAVTSRPAPDVRVRNPIGAGDCLVAGTAARLREGTPLAEAVRWGVALAAASCETLTAGDVDPARARELL